MTERPLELLHAIAGPDANFRAGQREAIEAVVDQRRRVLLVQRTGWGKSAVYFIATKLLRDAGAGPTILVSPLLALMRNQIQMAERAGVSARTINSENRDDWEEIRAAIGRDEVDLLLVSPERFNNPGFRAQVLPTVARSSGLLVIDEAHCISDWGHDFRPDYRRLVRVLELLPTGAPVLCTTATANDRVIEDVQAQLGAELTTLRGSLARESLALSMLKTSPQPERLAWLAQVVPSLEGSGVIYVLTVADTTRVASFLRTQGVDAHAYSGETESERRLELEDALLANEVKALVATSALGMGFDKPDLGFVIHYQSPGSAIAYYQQVGRAGRALPQAPVVLLRGPEDRDIQDYFIGSAFPHKERAEEVIRLLDDRGEPVSENEILASVNVRAMRLKTLLKVLEVEGALERVGSRWLRTSEPWSFDEERVRRVTAARRAEQAVMEEYGGNGECLMAFLLKQLDDPSPQPCGRCMVCTGSSPAIELDPGVVAKAREHLRWAELLVEPRLQWPTGMGEPKGRIAAELRLQPGRALSVLGDGGFGGLVRKGREAGEFSEALVDAAAELIGRRWRPDPFPTWVTCVPSTRHPELVPLFTEWLAKALELPFLPVLSKTRETAPQAEMENSQQQLANVWGAFTVEASEVPPGQPVLLVDDLQDSRWTLTLVGAALLDAGSGPVSPFVLAKAVSD
ncbi:MAG: RecQ family ATP-dependent DNA helicase [Actinomycetota bacterium]